MPEQPKQPLKTPTDVISNKPAPVQPLVSPSAPLPKPKPSPTPAQPQASGIRARQSGSSFYGGQEARQIGDSFATRNLIYDNVVREASKIDPEANSRFRLALTDVHYADPDKFSLKQQKEAILGNKTLSRRLRGTWTLSDAKTGDKVDQRKMTIAQVPHMTERGTFILDGTEYILASQMRLRPGVFTRIKSNGETEAHINTLPGKGVAHRYFFEPESSVFRLNIGQSKVPLYPLLKTMGVTDTQIRDAWGPEIAAINKPYDSPHIIDKIYQRVVRKADPDAPTESKRQAVANEFMKMELDPEVTKRTLGKEHKTLTAEAILDTTKKLLSVNRRETEPDDRDHLAFQTLMGPEDLIAERIGKDRQTLRNMIWFATYRGNLDHIQPGVFSKAIRSVFTTSGLGQAAEEVNAAELVDHQGRITRLGEGGIGDAQSIPSESRAVHPSQMGFIDPVKTPECNVNYCSVMTYDGWKLWPDVTSEDKLACLIDNKLEFHNPEYLFEQEYDGEILKASTRSIAYAVTPTHRMWIQPYHSPKTEWRFETAEEVHDRYMRHRIGGHGPYVGCSNDKEIFELRGIDTTNMYRKDQAKTLYIDIEDWCEFIGWYHSEGNVNTHKEPRSVFISQSQKANPGKFAIIETLLNRLPFKWSYRTHKGKKVGFLILDKRLAVYLNQFGYCYDKWIPEELFHVNVEARKKLLEALLLGDGRRDRKGVISQFCTTSSKLAQDVQRLAFGLGQSSAIAYEPEKRKKKDGSDNLTTIVVHLHKEITRTIENNERALYQEQPIRYTKEYYKGKVYCAQVPGGLLYCKIGDKGGFWSGNSFKAGVDLRTAYGVKKGADGRMYAPFRDTKTNKIVYHSPQSLADMTVALPGELQSNRPVISAMDKGRLTYVPRERAQLELTAMENTFSPVSNMVPMKSGVKGQRVSMGARMLTQALPLMNAEAPHVQSGVRLPGRPIGSTSYEQMYGRYMGIVTAPKPGKVLSVTPDEMKVKHDDGTMQTFDLYNHAPFNRKTFLHNTPHFKPGERFNAGEVLARSNYTDKDGTAALGVNARVAYLPFRGQNYEDAAVISESMAKRFTSEHMYQHQADYGDGTHMGKRAYVSLFPAKYDKKKLETLDDHGAVKPGTVVEHGDPLVLMANEKERTHNQVHRSGKGAFSDASITWEHHAPGVVTDVVHSKKGALVTVKAYMPMQVGDKMCYDSETEILTENGWKSITEVSIVDKVATLKDGCIFEYINPSATHMYSHDGRMYRLQTTQVDLLVTDNHKLYAAPRDKSYGLHEAKDLHGKRYSLKRDGGWIGNTPDHIEFTAITVKAGQSGRGQRTIPPLRVETKTYLMLLGMYLSEGNIVNQEASGTFGFDITQIKSKNRKQMIDALKAANIKFTEHGKGTKVRIYSKQWMLHLKQFGARCYDKFIPNEVFGWDTESLRVLYEWLMWGDGSRTATSHQYISTSKRLADDVQRLALHIGMSANISATEAKVGQIKGKTYNFAKCYRVSVFRNKNSPTINHGHAKTQNAQLETWEQYSGNVYCVTMPVGNVVYVRRNGKPVWCGNSGRYGDKSVLSDIVPDDQMPHGEDGKPYEVLISPLGIISRTNPAQMIEAALGKIAAKTGKPYKIEDFGPIPNLTQYAMDELKKHGLSDTETMTDPITGRKIPNVFTGNRFYMKLHHVSESKLQGRGVGGGYDVTGTPSKGGATGSKRLSSMDSNALLSHGATSVLHDAHTIRGQKNDDYWLQFLSGHTPPEPKVPMVYEKFINDLKGAGVNVVRTGTKTQVMALTNKDLRTLTEGRELQNASTVDWKEGLKPIKGGLFDAGLTGGHTGNRWSQITLHEPLPNPVMEEPIRRLLNLTEQQYLDTISGSGKHTIDGKTGPHGLKDALEGLNIKKEIVRAEAEIASGKKSIRDHAVRRLGYLKSAERLKMHPSEWVLDAIPVLPPMFRPVSMMQGKKGQIIADPNELYKEAFEANKVLKDLSTKISDVSEERLNLYNAFKGITGLGDPIQAENRKKSVKGILQHIFGPNPKFGVVQQKLLGASVNLVGRGVVIPNPEFNMDEIGIPEHKAWDVYQPFIIRGLVRNGVPKMAAMDAFKNRTKPAREILLKTMSERPVLVNRYPVLHRYGLMAFMPKLVKGDAIHTSPIITKGFGMDYDGDTAQFHVPVSETAKQDALDKMLPSKNLYSGANFKPMYVPNQEFVQGLHAASAMNNNLPAKRVFATRGDALRAYKRGEIDLGTNVEIIGK